MKSTLFTEDHKEIVSDSFLALQNESLLRVHLKDGKEVITRKGSVVASQGEIAFTRLDERSDEEALNNSPLLRASGQGDVFVADNGAQIHLMLLEDESLTVLGNSALAFDGRLRYSVREAKVNGLADGGFWKLHVSGSGSLAISSKGTPVMLRTTAGEHTRTDLWSTIAWSSNLAPQLKPSLRLDSSAGLVQDRYYFSFSGDGWVLVQPGE